MLEFNDPRWSELEGPCRTLFDPRPLLQRLESCRDTQAVWSELWDGLRHQGDVGVASYAAIPHLVRIHQARGIPDSNTYALVGAIELDRAFEDNPEVPGWLRDSYSHAWVALPGLALHDLALSDDKTLVRSALAVLAIARGLEPEGDLLLRYSGEEIAEMVEAYESGS